MTRQVESLPFSAAEFESAESKQDAPVRKFVST
jgi:hypothetical protein